MYKPGFQYCPQHVQGQIFKSCCFFPNYVKIHAKDGSNQQKQEDESSSEVASKMHNPWFANHVCGLSGPQLRKVQLVSPQHRKIASDLSLAPHRLITQTVFIREKCPAGCL
jgi:hypothetical protein